MSSTGTYTSQALAEWIKLFPRQITETYTSSVKFMKQLTVVAISTITYLKNILPEDSYTVENFAGIRLRILKKKCRDELSQFIVTATMQAFEAFDKKYLHKMVICFYDGDCKAENLIEYHLFEYSYTSEGTSMNIKTNTRNKGKHSMQFSFDNIKDRTTHLIRACIVIMQASHQGLPPSYDVSLRLYYNEDTPKDYQAPGFVGVENEEDHLSATLTECIKLGFVETPFHRFASRTYIKENYASSHEANPTQNPPEFRITPEGNDFEDSTASKCHDLDSNEARVQCPCNLCDHDDDAYALIMCQYCHTQQHAACFGLYGENAEEMKEHCCIACSDADPSREPTDPRLAGLDSHQRQCLSVFRRALVACACAVAAEQARGASVSTGQARGASVSAQQLGARLRLAPRAAAKLLRALQRHGVVAPGRDDPSAPRRIFQESLKLVKFNFSREGSDTIEPLSQASQLDPLEEILSLTEKLTLKTVAATSKLIQPDPPRVVKDEFLEEYANVISELEQKKDPPLNASPISVDAINQTSRKRKAEGPARVGLRVRKVCCLNNINNI